MKWALILGVWLTTGCSSLLYYPSSQKYFDPQRLGLKPESIEFQNRKGQKIHAWWFQSKKQPALGTFFYFHGNAENLTSHFATLSWLPDQGYNYFIFDYPGYGQSEGKPNPEDNVLTGQDAMSWVHQNKDSAPLIVYGQSMGSIVAMKAVELEKDRLPIRAVIVEGSFSSFQRIARKKLAQHWVTWLLQPMAYLVLSDRWAPHVAKLAPIPLIVVHGRMDPVVEFEHGERVFADAGEPKLFIDIPTAQHGDCFWVEGGRYRKVLLEALAHPEVWSSQGPKSP